MANRNELNNMNTFPTYTLSPGMTILDLFCAGFLGQNTTRHIQDYADDGNTVYYTGVDNDNEKMCQMIELYPEMDFIVADIFGTEPKQEYTYDMLICDQWTQYNDIIYQTLDKYAAMSNQWLLVSTNVEYIAKLPLNVGSHTLECLWRRSDYKGGTYWAVYGKV